MKIISLDDVESILFRFIDGYKDNGQTVYAEIVEDVMDDLREYVQEQVTSYISEHKQQAPNHELDYMSCDYYGLVKGLDICTLLGADECDAAVTDCYGYSCAPEYLTAGERQQINDHYKNVLDDLSEAAQAQPC